jgi:hexosaminidase
MSWVKVSYMMIFRAILIQIVKINMFHWHIVDSQSFPLEVPDFPEIATKGAYSPNEIYSAANIQDIVSYAATVHTSSFLSHLLAANIIFLSAELTSSWYHAFSPSVSFITHPIQEIDTPGHTAVLATSHPEHIACPFSTPWASFANDPPAGQLRLASSATSNFTATLISSIAKTLPSSMFSTGGDELNTNCYAMDSQTQQELKSSGKTLEQALSTFVQANHAGLVELGKTPVVWEGGRCPNLFLRIHSYCHLWCRNGSGSCCRSAK